MFNMTDDDAFVIVVLLSWYARNVRQQGVPYAHYIIFYITSAVRNYSAS